MVVKIENFENPDIECNECGESDWSKFQQGTPPRYPGGKSGSDVVRRQYSCNNCDGHAQIYTEGGHHRLTGNMR